MKVYIQQLFIGVGLCLSHFAWAQKPVIDSNTYQKWPIASVDAISDDGEYVSIFSQDRSSTNPKGSFKLKATKGTWEINITPNRLQLCGKGYCYQKSDTLVIGLLGKDQINTIPGVRSFQCYGKNTIIYQVNQPKKRLVVYNLATNRQVQFDGIEKYWFNELTHALLLLEITDVKPSQSLKVGDITNGQSKVIWKGEDLQGQVESDKNGKYFAFIGKNETNSAKSIYHFSLADTMVKKFIDEESEHLANYRINRVIGISTNKGRVFFSLSDKPDERKKDITLASVDIWSYKDAELQSLQLLSRAHEYAATIDPTNQRYVFIGDLEAQIVNHENQCKNAANTGTEYILVKQYGSGNGHAGTQEESWNRKTWYSVRLLSLSDGAVKRVSKCLDNINWQVTNTIQISPSGRYVTYYDKIKRNYFSYEIKTGELRNLTSGLKTTWTSLYWKESVQRGSEPEGIAGWTKDGSSVILYDQYDLYLADLAGRRPTANLTGGYGKQNQIVLKLCMPIDIAEKTYGKQAIDPAANLLAYGFNMVTKEEGLYRISVRNHQLPKCLIKGAFVINGLDAGDNYFTFHDQMVKAKDADAYVIMRMSATSYPNFYYSNDLQHFTALTNLQPQRTYNWLTTELINWKTYDGTMSQGILYKPENFDPAKKYPMIVEYYQRNSEGLNVFLQPDWTQAAIDIPTYVSRGYLVFVPDIHYKVGHFGQSALNCVESGARFLTRFAWVDAKHIGINGHSFGGAQTDYIVAHSSFFAAACAAAGWADHISAFNAIRKSRGISRQYNEEGNHVNMGASFWQRPNLYIENSAIFKAANVTTPLLMMNNKGDTDVDFDFGGIEFFTALRRLAKRVWMLQYDGENHVISGELPSKDFTLRVQQFFDHYLKGAPAPVWMTKGVPAKIKQIDSGLEIDNSGAKP